ncbi:MAG: hypothetical protein M3N52_03055 [Actinomycetota bacterium]|nr:hypothetical protein [Actinomycetota bacterium]
MPMTVLTLVDQLLALVDQLAAEEDGFSTAELLGNAALGIAALVAIWAVLQTLGVNVISWIQTQLGIP